LHFWKSEIFFILGLDKISEKQKVICCWSIRHATATVNRNAVSGDRRNRKATGCAQRSLRSHEETVLSKVKTPQDKKRQSYEHDRRNRYGENQKSSRKNIPRSKQRSHQDERRSVRQVLSSAQGSIASEVADEAQSQALIKGRMKKLNGFRKSPDRPLGKIVERRLRRRTAERE
jgi:hypothetical protein